MTRAMLTSRRGADRRCWNIRIAFETYWPTAGIGACALAVDGNTPPCSCAKRASPVEGWTAVLEHFDQAWDYKRKSWLAAAVEKEADAPSDPARAARLAAWRWCMIALTRPMDTLVISLSDPSSSASEIIKKAAKEHSDFAETRDS